MAIIPLRFERHRFFSEPDWFPAMSTETETFRPVLNIAETEKDFQVTVELPGLDEKDIQISLSKNVLNIQGEKRTEKDESEKNYHRVERTYGSFLRAIPFKTELDADKIEAQFSKGVLSIHLPKAPAAIKTERKIPIKST